MTQKHEDNSEHTQRTLTTAVGELSEVVRTVMESQQSQLRTQEKMQRRDIRWRNIRTALIAISIVAGPLIYSIGIQRVLAPQKFTGDYAAMVRIQGTIDANQRANAQKVTRELQLAFEDPKAKGVVILINSPGGSPVQSSIIHDRIHQLRSAHPEKEVRVVAEDMLTSGAYFIAVAALKVCVDRSTMTGSIGVVMSGWGLDKVIDRINVERRVFTAGTNKVRLDAFQPLRKEDEQKATELLAAIHDHFIDVVKSGRGDRLKGTDEMLFSGDYWTGDKAAELGLVDGLCNVNDVLDDMGVKHVKDYTQPASIFSKLSTFGVLAEQLLSVEQASYRPMLLP